MLLETGRTPGGAYLDDDRKYDNDADGDHRDHRGRNKHRRVPCAVFCLGLGLGLGAAGCLCRVYGEKISVAAQPT